MELQIKVVHDIADSLQYFEWSNVSVRLFLAILGATDVIGEEPDPITRLREREGEVLPQRWSVKSLPVLLI